MTISASPVLFKTRIMSISIGDGLSHLESSRRDPFWSPMIDSRKQQKGSLLEP